jgi:hypothetical protein
MAQNPLQQFFRQPKIYVSLPSRGIYNKPGTISGDAERIAVYGMTGMDEIIMKTPDALLTGESTVKIIQSCCPSVTDAWDINLLDIEMLLTAIRIATFGNEISVTNVCAECQTVNSYDINLNSVIDYFSNCQYENTLVLQDLKIITRPLTYKQSSDFALRNFEMQQKSKQLELVTTNDERKAAMDSLLDDLARTRNEVFSLGIESIDTGSVVVTERAFIKEWVDNVDASVMNAVVTHIEKNRDAWSNPQHHVKCENCNHEEDIYIDLDQANFFVKA